MKCSTILTAFDEVQIRSLIAFTAADWVQVDHTDLSQIDLAEARALFEVRLWGALAVALWVAGAVIYTAPTPGALAWFGLMPVVAMTMSGERFVSRSS